MPASLHCHIADPVTIEPLVRLWLLRILVVLGAHKEFLYEYGFHDNLLAAGLGLEHWIDADADDFDQRTVLAELRAMHRKAEQKPGDIRVPKCLRLNMQRLSALVGLPDTDCRVLEFAILIHSERLLGTAVDWLGDLSSGRMFHALSIILNLPGKNIRTALDHCGTLARTGLVSVDRSSAFGLCSKLDLLSAEFADLMTSTDADPVSLLRNAVAPSVPPTLALTDYEHIAASLGILVPYLRHSLETGRTGVNVLLHGAPGTGKTQLARVLAASLGYELFEVASEDEDGDSIDGDRRLRAFRAAQGFFGRRRALILFDEIEDVFNDGDSLFSRKSTAQLRKAWVNRMLEENPVPTLWLSNTIQGLDSAFIRRFDMIFELPIPPRAQRERIVRAACHDLIDAARITRIAETQMLAPAVVARAASVVRIIRDQLGPADAGHAFERLVNNTLKAQGHSPMRSDDPGRLPELYDPGFIQADADLAQIAETLKRSSSARLCLIGPPGSGKTAYGRWLANQLEMPLLTRQASDLLGPYVGMSERNIADAFHQAEQENALLMVDEIDSFLQDRQGAHHSWEVTLVNEMLTQMEAFPGVFIASANRMDGFDQAALRRFDLKVAFGYLSAAQVIELLRRHCEKLGLAAPTTTEELTLLNLQNLTPGDFAVVIRQHRFRPLATAADFVAALQAESVLKPGAKVPIGFLH